VGEEAQHAMISKGKTRYFHVCSRRWPVLRRKKWCIAQLNIRPTGQEIQSLFLINAIIFCNARASEWCNAQI
jgi:hypothetical protein